MSKSEILNSSLSTLSSEPRMLNRSLRIAKPPNPQTQASKTHLTLTVQPQERLEILQDPFFFFFYSAFSAFSLCMQMYKRICMHITRIHTYTCSIHTYTYICIYFVYIYIHNIYVHRHFTYTYLMAAANATDPKTGRKTEAERPAVSLCTGRS